MKASQSSRCLNARKPYTPIGHAYNFAKLRLAQRHHRKTRLPNQWNRFQSRIAFDLSKCDRPSQRFNCGKIDCGPVAFFRGWVCIGGQRHFSDSNYGLFLAAMVEKDFIALLHFAKTISRSKIAHAGPASLPIGNEIRPRIGRRLLFHQPELFHVFKFPASKGS